MRIRKAGPDDIERIGQIYDRIHDAQEKGLTVTGWIRDVYPTVQTARDALARDDLFVMEDGGHVVAAAVINRIQVPDYRNAKWRHEADDNEVMVLHTLTVDPSEAKKGYGRAFVRYYEEYARNSGCPELRMDTNARNLTARAMYAKMGYEETDIVPCVFNGIPDVMLVCLEKRLD